MGAMILSAHTMKMMVGEEMADFDIFILAILAIVVICFLLAPYFALNYIRNIHSDLSRLNHKLDDLIDAIKGRKS